jgi:putative ABC transport system permease protein
MWRNFFTVAFRNVSKNKVFTVINVSGLAIGLASSILILLFIISELSYDRFHEHKDRIHRLYIEGDIGEQPFRVALTSMVMAPTFTEEIPEIVDYVRLDVYNQYQIWYKEEQHLEDHFLFADPSIFDIFSIRMLRGDPGTALSEPNSIILTEEKARLYFGDEDPLGLPLHVNNDSNLYYVTGVIEALPENSHFFADFIASMETFDWESNQTWFHNSIFSYVLLDPGADAKVVEQLMAEVMAKHIRGELKSILGVGPEEWAAGGNTYGIFLQPVLDIHLQPDIEVGMDSCIRPVHDRLYIHIFGLIAFFILVIASINFMNLSTARSATRAREIGIRKAAGSDRPLLIKQFLTESVVMSLLALAIALILVELSLPWFNRTMDMDLRLEQVQYGYLFPVVVLLSLIVGLLSGIYPAMFLSGFRPVDGIRGGFVGNKRAGRFRSMMVVVQFTISVAIIVGTLIVSNQLRFLLNKDLGYEKRQVVVIKRTFPLQSAHQAFCREIEKIPGVVSASNSTTYLGYNNSTETYQIEGRKKAENYLFATNYVDEEFMKTYNFNLAGEGSRFFEPSYSSNRSSVLINKAAVTEFGITDPLHTTILEPTIEGDTNHLRIIGVIEDFHHSSLREPVGPYMLRYKEENLGWSGYINVRLGVAGKGIPITIGKIKNIWIQMTGDAPFQFFFLEEELNNYYQEERRTGRLSFLFAVLSIFIACLGLFGLTLHHTHRRIREIGIRKAMGASVGNVIMVVSREVVQLMGISILIAWIASYLFMQNWLEGFPFRIGFKPWIYLVSALSAMLIAIISVTLLAYRAARRNPATILHYE